MDTVVCDGTTWKREGPPCLVIATIFVRETEQDGYPEWVAYCKHCWFHRSFQQAVGEELLEMEFEEWTVESVMIP